MKLLDKETVLKWIEIDISFREVNNQYPIGSYYEYLKVKAHSACYTDGLDECLKSLIEDSIIEKHTNNSHEYFTLII